MDFRHLGQSGLVVSAVGLGTNNFGFKLDTAQCREVLDAALHHGITLLDTSDSYGASEERLGALLAGRRNEVVLATKFGSDIRTLPHSNGEDWGARASRRYIRRAVEGSLRRLRTDWIDLYQLHRPDSGTPIEETLATLDDLIREGKIRYAGSSNFSGWQIAHADWIARSQGTTRFVSAQNQYNLLDRSAERELVPALTAYGIGLLPYYPLANGLLTGKYRRGEAAPEGSRIALQGADALLSPSNFDRLEAIEDFARQRGLGILDTAIGGLAAQPGVASVIAGATSAAQVAANVSAGEWKPTHEDLAALRSLTE